MEVDCCSSSFAVGPVGTKAGEVVDMHLSIKVGGFEVGFCQDKEWSMNRVRLNGLLEVLYFPALVLNSWINSPNV